MSLLEITQYIKKHQRMTRIVGARVPMREDEFFALWVSTYRTQLWNVQQAFEGAPIVRQINADFMNIAMELFDRYPEIVEDNHN